MKFNYLVTGEKLTYLIWKPVTSLVSHAVTLSHSFNCESISLSLYLQATSHFEYSRYIIYRRDHIAHNRGIGTTLFRNTLKYSRIRVIREYYNRHSIRGIGKRLFRYIALKNPSMIPNIALQWNIPTRPLLIGRYRTNRNFKVFRKVGLLNQKIAEDMARILTKKYHMGPILKKGLKQSNDTLYFSWIR